ncbi:ATPase [Thermococcus sp.]|uniref:ATPase n=1 Tax=Thermococcus sp. TaxID=35749 RepID=UPI00263483EC|nr:ATPase [Thermococcus sp.]
MAILDVDIPSWLIDLIYGNTGSGKSYFAGWLVEQAWERGRRFIVLDTKVKNHIGLVQLKGVRLLKVIVGKRYNWRKLLDFDQVLVVPTRGTINRIGVDGLVDQYYKPLLDEIFRRDRDRIVVVEEAHRYNPSSRRPGKELEQLFREGRDGKLYTVAITQSIADFPKLLFRQAQRHFIFQHYVPNDIIYLNRMVPGFSELNNRLREHDLIEFIPPNKTRIIKRELVIRRTRHFG